MNVYTQTDCDGDAYVQSISYHSIFQLWLQFFVDTNCIDLRRKILARQFDWPVCRFMHLIGIGAH